jgi:spore germination protein YaaH
MDDPNKWWNYAYDYKAIAPYIDYMEIMAYDEHYKTSAPGPIASLGWFQDIVNYSTTVVPANKIVIGVPSYAYDWAKGEVGVPLTYSEAVARAKKYHATIKMDPVSKEQHYTYWANGKSHDVWFENGATISYKLDMINKKNLRGLGIWRIGIEDPNFWKEINTKF